MIKDKETVLKLLDIHERLRKAVDESNLDDKWKTIINGLSSDTGLKLENEFILNGGSLR